MPDTTTPPQAQPQTEKVRVLVTETNRTWYELEVKKGTTDKQIRDHVAMLDQDQLDQHHLAIEDDGSYWGVDEIQRPQEVTR